MEFDENIFQFDRNIFQFVFSTGGNTRTAPRLCWTAMAGKTMNSEYKLITSFVTELSLSPTATEATNRNPLMVLLRPALSCHKDLLFCFSACACGKWICTGEKCPEKHQQGDSASSIRSNSLADDQTEEDEDIEYDEEEPEDDPDVQDVNWF